MVTGQVALFGQVMSSNLSDQMSLGSLYSVVKTLIVSGAGQTRCPIELFWTAKNQKAKNQ